MKDTIIQMVVACDKNMAIGYDNKLLWDKLPSDMAHFRSVTYGTILIMGRKTYESIGHALPKRINIVLSRDPNFKPDDVIVSHSFIHAAQMAAKMMETLKPSDSGRIISVIGGSRVYYEAEDYADRILVTEVDYTAPKADVYYKGHMEACWKEKTRMPTLGNTKDPYSLNFVTYERAGGRISIQGVNI